MYSLDARVAGRGKTGTYGGVDTRVVQSGVIYRHVRRRANLFNIIPLKLTLYDIITSN